MIDFVFLRSSLAGISDAADGRASSVVVVGVSVAASRLPPREDVGVTLQHTCH